MQPISIVLADAEFLIRVGLKHLLRNEPFQIVGEAENEKELLQLLQETQPQVVILDYNQPKSFAHETVQKINTVSPNTNILIISSDNDKQSIYTVLEDGVNSFLTKHCDDGEIVDAVQATAKGERFFCNTVLEFILEKSFSKEEKFVTTPLTPRETEIVRLVAKGLIAKEIAKELNLSTHTVYTHRKNIMKKLNLNTASELVLYAVNQGIVTS